MKLRTFAAACAALTTLTAGSAFAADLVPSVTAKLQQPVSERTKFIAGGAMFVCQADACVAESPISQTFSTAACKTIANKVGVIAAFEGRGKTFEADRLAACNATAVAKTATGPQLAKQ
jgi:hypothetical protein